ncbi:MAG: phosphatase PAP2 family protein [Flavobacteriales bacterium]|nr:phosphatase PAP2 family protein [Flavobacteriales bacterium]
MLSKILQGDQDLFLLLNGLGTEAWDGFWVFVSSTQSAIPLFLLIVFLLIKKYRKHFWVGLIIISIAVGLADFTSVHCFKNVFMRLRPSHAPELADQIRLLVSKGGLYGFVSSHAANFFALAAIASSVFSDRKHLPYIFYTWAVLVAYSRIYVGKHYPLDILGGAILGVFIAKLIWAVAKKIKKKYPSVL